ncbi:MAG: hypothetical protein R3B13_11370 [Polyangiaceae bacterium]
MALTARVKNGRLVLDEPTNLPEGAEVHLQIVRDDDWSNEEGWHPAVRERLETALEQGSTDIAAGRTADAGDFLSKLPGCS